MHFKPAEQRRALVGTDRVAKRRHRGGQRLPDRLGTGVALPQRADALVLLSQVRQVKVDSEGPRHCLCPGQRPACYQRRNFGICSGCRATAAAGAGLVLAGSDYPVAQVLDVVEQIPAIRLGDHLTQDLAKQPDVPPHCGRHPPRIRVPALGTSRHPRQRNRLRLVPSKL